jgi:hypothetical protein
MQFFIPSELETASFEPNLSQALAKNAVKALSMFCIKCDNLVRKFLHEIKAFVGSNIPLIFSFLPMNNLFIQMHPIQPLSII